MELYPDVLFSKHLNLHEFVFTNVLITGVCNILAVISRVAGVVFYAEY